MVDVYFTVQEANLFVFYRIPKEFFTNQNYKKLSAEAKILYGLLLDRNSLSIQNKWIDERGYIYIYFSREEAMEMLGISNKKAGELFKELREVGLVEEIRQGLGKANIIFVKKFVQTPQTIGSAQMCKNYTSGDEKNTLQEMKKLHGNNTEYTNTELNETELTRNLTTQVSNKTHTCFIGEDNITPVRSVQKEEEEKVKPVCGHVPVSLEQSQAEIQVDNDATFVREHLKKLVHTCSLERIRYHLEHWPETETRTHTVLPQEARKEEEQKTVCEQTVSLEALQQEIQAVIGETIVLERLKKLVHTASIERIRYHLSHWHIHKKNQTKKGAGYFITVVENDIPPQEQEHRQYQTEKISQRNNFEQREYTDEELEKYYANLN